MSALWGGGGFHGYQDVFCGCGREFLSCIQFVFALPVCVLSAWRPLAVRCDEAVHLAVQKAQGQHNTIPLRSACLSVWPRSQSVWSTWLKAQASKGCSMKSVNCISAVTMCAVISGLACTYCMCLCLHCSVRAGQWMWPVSAIGGLQTARLLSQQGLALALHPAHVLLSVCVRPTIKSPCPWLCLQCSLCSESNWGWDTETLLI